MAPMSRGGPPDPRIVPKQGGTVDTKHQVLRWSWRCRMVPKTLRWPPRREAPQMVPRIQDDPQDPRMVAKHGDTLDGPQEPGKIPKQGDVPMPRGGP